MISICKWLYGREEAHWPRHALLSLLEYPLSTGLGEGAKDTYQYLKPSIRSSPSYQLLIWSSISIIGTTERLARVFHAHPHSTLKNLGRNRNSNALTLAYYFICTVMNNSSSDDKRLPAHLSHSSKVKEKILAMMSSISYHLTISRIVLRSN